MDRSGEPEPNDEAPAEWARQRRREALVAEVAELAKDPDDTAERGAVMAEMDAVTAD